MRLLHWNVHMWQDVDGSSNQEEVAQVIRDVSPDVVSLVEVDESWGETAGLRRIADQLGYAWIFVPTFEYRGEGGFGNALMTSHPALAVEQWQLLSPRLYAGTEQSEQRSVLLARLDVAGVGWWIGSTHLPRSDTAGRAEASGQLLKLLGRLPTPWAVCGDFNQPPNAWVPASLETAPNPARPTYPAQNPAEAIDYCIASGVSVTESTVLPAGGSDHLPIVIDIE